VDTDISGEHAASFSSVEVCTFRNRLDTIGKTLDLSKDPVFSGDQNCIINGQKAT
jgi:hypothetical protein